MIFELIDGQGTSNIRIGINRTKLQAILGPGEEFRRTPDAPLSEDFNGFMATYGSNDKLIMMEFCEPATPMLSGIPLLGAPLASVINEIQTRLGLKVTHDAEGAFIDELGLGLWSPDGPTGNVEGVQLGMHEPASMDPARNPWPSAKLTGE